MNHLNELIAKGDIKETGAIKELTIEGLDKKCLIYSIPLEYLFYNDQNGRINTEYNKFIVTNKGIKLNPGTDEKNPGYNKKFEKFIYDLNKREMDTTTDSIKDKGQQEPGVVLSDGRIIDGNRRYTALRKIQRDKGTPQYFKAVILNLDFDKQNEAKIIKMLELDLQMGHEERVDYDPINRVFDVYDTVKVKKILTEQEFAHSSNKKIKDVKKDLLEAEIILKYLKFINAEENNYYLAKQLQLDGPINEIMKIMNFIKHKGEDLPKVLDTIFAHLVNIYTIEKGDITREIRHVITYILKTPNGTDFIEKNNKHVDDIYDALREGGETKTAAELTKKITGNPQIKNSCEQFRDETKTMVLHGRIDKGRGKAVQKLVLALDNLKEITDSDLIALNPDEKSNSKELLQNIAYTVSNHLKVLGGDV